MTTRGVQSQSREITKSRRQDTGENNQGIRGKTERNITASILSLPFSLTFTRNFMRPRMSAKVIKTKRKRNSLWRQSNHTRDKSILHERQHLDNKHFMTAF